jgi:flagellar biogenesis protein FliO
MKTSRSRKSNPITGDTSPLSVIADEASLSTLRNHTGLLSRAWEWLQARQVARSSTRRLRVAETVSLGEKRFVAVVQVDGRHFLLAGGPTNIVLLAQLDTKEAFGDVLKKTLTAPRKQVAKRKRPANFATQEQVNPTNSHKDVLQKTVTSRLKQKAKPAGKQTAFAQGPSSAPLTNHLNGTERFGDLLRKTMSAGNQPGNHAREQNSKSKTEQTGYFA